MAPSKELLETDRKFKFSSGLCSSAGSRRAAVNELLQRLSTLSGTLYALEDLKSKVGLAATCHHRVL
ncbi:hypothetical protein NQZ68_012168 [Dissostichus eleginoides]|nr:hypothetical protein NQZ68_012168 [Dissostichus eleginoides]